MAYFSSIDWPAFRIAFTSVHAMRGIGHEHDVVGIGPDVALQRFARLREQARQPASKELYGFRLQSALPALIPLEDRARTGAVAAVIEEGDAGPQQEVVSSFGDWRDGCIAHFICHDATPFQSYISHGDTTPALIGRRVAVSLESDGDSLRRLTLLRREGGRCHVNLDDPPGAWCPERIRFERLR